MKPVAMDKLWAQKISHQEKKKIIFVSPEDTVFICSKNVHVISDVNIFSITG